MCSWQPFGARSLPGADFLEVVRNHGGDLQLDEENSRVLQNVAWSAAPSSAIFNGRRVPELILACEWGPVRIFRNDHGRFTAWDWRVPRAPISHCGSRSQRLVETASPRVTSTVMAASISSRQHGV